MFEAATRVKSTHLTKPGLKTRKKGKNIEIKKNFYINLYLKYRLNRIHSFLRRLMPEEALTSFTVFDAYR